MAADLRVSENSPPAIQAIEIELRMSENELNGVAQRNDNFTSPEPIFPFEIKLRTRYINTAEIAIRKLFR